MLLQELIQAIEEFAPLGLQEDYDNAGLIVGNPHKEVHAALIAVDVNEEVMDEAVRRGCDVIVTHHPIVFRALKKFNSKTLVERCVERAIKEGIALYACHTNLDSAPDGMSWRLGEMLGVENQRVLEAHGEKDAAGRQPGFGIVGELSEEKPLMDYLNMVKNVLHIKAIRYTQPIKPMVKRIAICTGAGVELIDAAAEAEADLYLTADMKYHDFMLPDGRLTVADIGHFESEYCAIPLLYDIISKKLITFAVRKSECSCNPVNYLV